jgi:hypothetical protein
LTYNGTIGDAQTRLIPLTLGSSRRDKTRFGWILGFKNILRDVFCPKESDEDTNVGKSFDCFKKPSFTIF